MDDHGRFVWHELRVTDIERAGRFYGDLLGWTFTAGSTGPIIHADGTPIGGISPTKPGIPPHWTPYIAVADVDAAASAARAHGGIVTSGVPGDLPGVGRLAPILDADKAIFLVVRPLPGTPMSAPRSPAPGTFVWDRLRTPEPATAADFYRAVAGWNTALAPDGTAGVLTTGDGARVAEMVQTTQDRGWLPFVLVDSASAARDHAVSLGATAEAELTTTPDSGRFTVITDPEGATLALHEAP
ncbi:VOC family protein [Actinoallomurus iriomotensis]|uniref:Glyoxalase n=1 Tax=Actinoallomurus iriomotensis TaxID=478107 RepID=A0A9W6VNC7_9ACTN|nr:VOC family protein [Actinoallomurus iriomotensis]GLY78623.1 glyoxalase [Actinoallomurus iriomotensis]